MIHNLIQSEAVFEISFPFTQQLKNVKSQAQVVFPVGIQNLLLLFLLRPSQL